MGADGLAPGTAIKVKVKATKSQNKTFKRLAGSTVESGSHVSVVDWEVSSNVCRDKRPHLASLSF